VAPRLTTSQARKYAVAIDRESAREMLEKKVALLEQAQAAEVEAETAAKLAKAAPPAKSARDEESALGAFLRSPVARTIAVTVAGTLTRSLLGTLMGKTRR